MANLAEQTITTGEVRLSFVHVFKPYAHNLGQEEKYSTTILVPKSDIVTKRNMDLAIDAAKRQGIAEKFQGVLPPILAIPVYDGDGVRPSDGMPFGEECKGHWVFTASSKQAIAVVNMNRQPVINESEIYSGVYGYVSITFFPYNSNGKKGIGCGLNCVLKSRDGEPLGGGVSVEKAFANIPVQQPTTQQMYQQPVITAQHTHVQQQPIAINPITGQPVVVGGVMGL